GRFCFAKPGEVYLVYLTEGGAAEIELSAAEGAYSLEWFNPREGGALERGAVREIRGGTKAALGRPPGAPDEDWLAVIRRKRA
ncbi:MAG: hypothetical protein JXA90_11950, partial [Planctomycetes bacterium]|nr:hypothetical protein [Planctomycetota bacterium]